MDNDIGPFSTAECLKKKVTSTWATFILNCLEAIKTSRSMHNVDTKWPLEEVLWNVNEVAFELLDYNFILSVYIKLWHQYLIIQK